MNLSATVKQLVEEGLRVNYKTAHRWVNELPEYKQLQEEKKANPSAHAQAQRRYQDKKDNQISHREISDIEQQEETLEGEVVENLDTSSPVGAEIRDDNLVIHPTIPEPQPEEEVEAWEDDLLWYGEVERRNNTLPAEITEAANGSVTVTVTLPATIVKFMHACNAGSGCKDGASYWEVKDLNAFVVECLEAIIWMDGDVLFHPKSGGVNPYDYFTNEEMSQLGIDYYGRQWEKYEEDELENQHEQQEQLSNEPPEETLINDPVQESSDENPTESSPVMDGVALRKELQRRFGKDKVKDQYVINRCRKTKPEGYLFDCVRKDFGIELEIAGKSKVGNLSRIVDEAG